jgi:FdhE protein
MNPETRILEPGQIEAPIDRIRFLFLAGRDLFASRAERFNFLAANSPLKDYLLFLAMLADAQQQALNQFPVLPVPDASEQALCREHAMPLLSPRSLARNPAWRNGLRLILQIMAAADLPDAACETIAGLNRMSEARLEEMADLVLVGNLAECSPAELPFIAAALQVYWVQMATSLTEDAIGRLEQGGLCPVCGSHPMVGMVKSGGAEQGLRYLCCSLCATRWHMVRIKCSNCESTGGINHFALEGSKGSVKAESCDDCKTYLKLLYLEKDSRMEAMTDDLATLALDMLMHNDGYVRGGPNLFLHPGMD